jgi:putative phage-type endonuclease
MAQRRVTPEGTMIMTAKQIADDREAWLRARIYREGVGYCIGSSEAPAILGIKDSGTPIQLWYTKVKGFSQPDNPNMMWGRLDEDTTARYWRDRNRSATSAVGLIANIDQPWHQTTLDRLVLECPLDRSLKRRCGLEIKHRGAFGSRRWHKELPDDVLCQICHQIFTSGLDHMHYAVRIGGNDYRQGVVRAIEDATTINFVVGKVNAFRDTYLAGRGQEVEPPWPAEDRASSLIELDAMLHPERSTLLTIEDLEPVIGLAQARAAKNRSDREEKIAKARLLRQADGARWVNANTDSGSELAYEFAPSERTRVDLDRLREKYPDVYADEEVVIHSTSWKINIADSIKERLPDAPEEN